MVIAERTVGGGGAAAAADGAAADANAVGGDQNVPGDGGNAINLNSIIPKSTGIAPTQAMY